ncbi:MAG: hypothetical protein K9G33_04755 [Sneathiella sp.]|nr:hypothetical protein [Sneathiella sp.]
MALNPLILLPAAALAVLIVILFIRLVAGRRDADLTPGTLTVFLRDQEPGENIIRSVISGDGKYALVQWQNGKGIGLVRSFGDKLVLQMLGSGILDKCDWRSDNTLLHIPRQGFAFPSVKFACEEEDRAALEAMLNGENDASA